MIKALIIDDEESAVNVVKLLLQKHVPQVTDVYTSNGAQQALQVIGEIKPDLIFLDIEMPYLNGFELLEKFQKNSFDVIFITAYDHYAIKAIKFSALDYLLKPIDTDELKLAVEKFIDKHQQLQNSKPLFENLLYNLNQPETNNYRLAVATTEGTFFYNAEEIIRCEAVGNYTRFYLKDKRPVTTTRTLKEYEDLLVPQKFLRIHRTHLVNTKYIESYSRDHELKMADGSAVQVSRRKWDDIKYKLSLLIN